MRQLSDLQLASFDTEYVDADRWQLVKGNIDRDFPDGKFRFLDLGGGTGRFADLLLAKLPFGRRLRVRQLRIAVGKEQAGSAQATRL